MIEVASLHYDVIFEKAFSNPAIFKTFVEDFLDIKLNITENVYTIVVLTSGDKHKRDICSIDFDPKDRDGVGIGEINHKIVYLCPKYVSNDTPEPYREWLRAIDDSLDGEVEIKSYKRGIIKKIFDLIKKDKTTPQEYARMKDEYSAELLKQKKFNEGIEKGERNKQIEIAKNLLKANMDIEFISDTTGLSIEEIKTIKQ